MNILGTTYVVDNNTLGQLSNSQRSSEFFRQRVRIPSDVLEEAASLYDIGQLRDNEYPTTSSVLLWLKKVMATVDVGDTGLVDLYANLGGADPLMVACALDGQDKDNEHLLGNTWVLVSNDKAVRAKALDFGIPVKSNAEFSDIINDSE